MQSIQPISSNELKLLLMPEGKGCQIYYPHDIGINVPFTPAGNCQQRGQMHLSALCTPPPLSLREIHKINEEVVKAVSLKLENAQKSEAKDKKIAILKTALQITFLAAAILGLCFGSPIVAPVALFLGIFAFAALHGTYIGSYANELGNTAYTEIGFCSRNDEAEFNPNSPSHQRIGGFRPTGSRVLSALLFPALHQAYTRVDRLERWNNVFSEQHVRNTEQFSDQLRPETLT